jgi:hypothetical protein
MIIVITKKLAQEGVSHAMPFEDGGTMSKSEIERVGSENERLKDLSIK